ncbi:tyrosine-type recombinase/integrase [Streptomyces sp. NPDC001233]
MASKTLTHGMGTFKKKCDCTRPTRCPHPYTITFRNAAGRQTEEGGFPNQTAATDRLIEIYNQKKRSGAQHSAAQEALLLGQKQFRAYADDYISGRRDWGESRRIGVKTALNKHIYPQVGSRRIYSFTPTVIERFISTMERDGIGLGAQEQAFITLKQILLSAHKRGAIQSNPFQDVVEPQYVPDRAVIPDLVTTEAIKATSTDERFRLVVDLMCGMGLRNCEALAVNVNNMVADDVYRITEQVSAKTNKLAKLKHRKPGEFREVPMPAKTRKAIERFTDKHGVLEGGYLLAGGNRTGDAPLMTYYSLNHAWKQATKKVPAPLPAGLVMYGFRHFFASNTLSNGIPITDVAEWMGHRSIEVTFRIYRHLLPSSIGRAAKILNLAL